MATPLPFHPVDRPPQPRDADAPVEQLAEHRDRLMMRAGVQSQDVDDSLPLGCVDPSCDMTLTNGTRSKHYWIRPGRGQGGWYCQAFWGTKQHRGEIVGIEQALRRRTEFRREAIDLVVDGWEGPPPSADGGAGEREI